MLKNEALGQLSAIADDDNRDFEDFAAAYKTMEEVVKEYPELSHYVLPIVVQTAADKGFNADIRPAAARVFNAAALNLPAEDVVKNVVRAFKRCPPFAYYLMPDLLSGRPELSAALFPEAEAGLAKIEANCVYSAAAAAKAALLCASDREAAAMLDSAFRPAKEKEDFSRVLYRSLGQIYSRHPALKEQIFSLLETPRLLKPQNYDAFYSNLGQIGLFDAGERGRVIGLLSSYLQKGDNTPASLTAAYKAVGEMMAAADDKRELETVMRTGLQNAANDTVSRKTAWRLLGDYDNLCSRVSFCRRVEKSADNEFGLQRVETIDAGELGVLLLGGDGTRSEKALNGYLGDVYRLLKEHGLHEKAAVYGVVYDFGDFMNVGFARRRQMEKYGRNIRIDRELSPETTDPKYVGEIFDKFLLPRISTDRGRRRLSADEAALRVRRLNIVAHCHGAYTALRLEEMMQEKMKELGYTPAERRQVQKQLLIMAQSPYCPLGQSQSTFVSFASVLDDEVSHYNNFEAAIRKINARREIPPCYFPGRQGSLFLVGSMGKDMDQHNFWGFHPSPEMSREGQALATLAAKVLINGVMTASEPIPSIENLAADTAESRRLFRVMETNGREIYRQITAESVALHCRKNEER